MKIFGVVGLGLAVGIAVAAFATQSPKAGQDATSIKSLADAEAAIDALTLRVNLLEQRLEKMEGGDQAAMPAVGAPVMKVESIETIQPDAETLAQIRQLNADADSLDDKAAALESSASSISIDNSPDADAAARSAMLKQRNSIKSQGGEARRQARQKRDEAKRLATPRQIIRGWSGKKSVELRTDRDLSATLGTIRVGSFVTAKGSLLDADDSSVTAMITSISAVAAPANF